MKLKLLSKMKMAMTTVFAVCALAFSSQAQTTLSAGDIMFIGVNSDPAGSPTADEFAVLFLEPVTSGTVIYFTDMGYTGNSSPYFQQNPNNGCGAGTGAVSDGLLRWTASGAVSAGTQLVIRVNPTSGSISASTGTLVIEVQTSGVGEGMNLSSAGEAIHAFQGSLNGSGQVTSATMIASLDYDALWTGTVSTCQFSSTISEDPGTGYEVEFSSHADNGYYNGSLTGTKAALQSAILNMSNWTTSNTTTYTLPISAPVTSTTWNGATWSNGAPSSTVDAVIASSTTPGAFTCKDLTINSSFALTLGAGVTATIHGDMTNSGNGISGTGNLTFSKSGTATLSGNAFSVLGVVTVSSGCTLSTASKLTIASNASNTGSIGNSAGSISGSVTVERHIPGKRCYRFLAHPFTTTQQVSILTDDIDITGNGGSTNGFTNTTTNNPSSYIWDVSTADNSTGGNNPGWSAITSATSSSWTKGGLLRVLVRGAKGEGLTGGAYTPSASTLDMTGTVNTGTQVITLTKGASSTFVGCGNPFPSPVQMNTLSKGSNVGANYYVWDATSGAKGAYVTNAFTASYILPIGGAFFTTVSANSNNTIEFQEADKSTSSPASIFKTTAANDWVELLISDSTLKWDRLLINFNDNSMDVQDQLDAVKLYNPGLDFFTLSKDGERLAIDVRPYTDKSSIPLGVTAYNRYNKYVIRTGDYNVPAGTKLILHDKYLNKQEELKAGFEYWFEVTADTLSQGNNRFEINMVGKPTGITTTNATAPKIQLIPNPARSEVKVSFAQLEGTAQVRLTNITGQVVYVQEVNAASGSITIPLTNMPSGMYIVELQGQNVRFAEQLIKE